MDPNLTLARLRNLQSRLDKTNNPDSAGEVALDITILAGKLDAWLSNEGELPDDWKPKEQEIVDTVLEDQKVWLVWRRFFWWYLLVGVYHTRELAERRCSCADGENLSIEEQCVMGSWRSLWDGS